MVVAEKLLGLTEEQMTFAEGTVEKVESGLGAEGMDVAAYVIAGGRAAYSPAEVFDSSYDVDRAVGDFVIVLAAVEKEPVANAVSLASASENWRRYWMVLPVQLNYLRSFAKFQTWFAGWSSDQQHWTWQSG